MASMTLETIRCGPHCHASEINGEGLKLEFHEMFRLTGDLNKKKNDKKKSKRKKCKAKDKKRLKNETTEGIIQHLPFLGVKSNPSSFAVFANVRQCVLEKQMSEATQLYLQTLGNRISDTESEDEDDRIKDYLIKVPKIVGIGLCSVFELIRESRKKHPNLCTKALQALLDMLQGQQPEELKSEPPEVIDTLFDLLLDISSQSLGDPGQSSSSSPLTSYACACLLSLAVAKGDTGKLLGATSAMLMSPRSLAAEEIPTPGILSSLQRSVHAVLLGKTIRPDWLTHGIPKSSLCDSFSVQIPKGKFRQSASMTTDGKFLYILSGGSIYKIGSSFSGTIKGQILMSRGGLKVDDRGWIGYAKGYLYFQPHSGTNNELIKIDKDTLKEKEHIELDASEWGPSACFTDGEHVGILTASKDVIVCIDILIFYFSVIKFLLCCIYINIKIFIKL
ncbi:E3 ubiquitin-protein ligase MYCBP2-like [Centruroides sculpturatus]|uniref:E3 ubiquitin-protein ligase MYCBP2-like n=1 Tax=Centruroides sculpturatus TaxID=218467 RepID=UPI000C6EF09D|nr:E3 ubiquitin-protein ligase MYCBP2-like [Centruroides sculpturatus]